MDSKRNKLFCRLAGFVATMIAANICSAPSVEAKSVDQYDHLRAGVAMILNEDLASKDAAGNVAAILGIDEDAEADEESDPKKSTLVMAKVKNTLNVREEPNAEADKVGYLYTDCGGEILEQREGWTKIKSGNLVGWASNDYLLFGEDAVGLAEEVGLSTVTISTETLRVRMEPSQKSGIYGLIAGGENYEVVSEKDGWVCIDYEGKDGYIASEYTTSEFIIDHGETIEEVKAREEEEKKAKLKANYGVYAAEASDEVLLAALIYCEAGCESYEGKLAVGSVVMNRVRSASYPNSIMGVIYASGQFTPAGNGKVDAAIAANKYDSGCLEAARAVINGDTNVGTATHFRRAGNREGIVIGAHVFW